MLKNLAIVAVLVLGISDNARPQVVRNGSKQEQPSQSKYDPSQPPKPYQWGELIAPANAPNWFLVGVALWAGIMALRTLKAIKKQADLMQQQNEMVFSKERGRLYVELDKFNPEPMAGVVYVVTASVSVFGPTDVTIDASELWAWIDDPKNPALNILTSRPVDMPKVIRARDKPTPIIGYLGRDTTLAGVEEIGDVLRGEKIVYCKGSIIFTNLFDRKYIFRVSKRFRTVQLSAEPTAANFVGLWENYGGQQDNGEYELKEEAKEKRSWFWRLMLSFRSRTN